MRFTRDLDRPLRLLSRSDILFSRTMGAAIIVVAMVGVSALAFSRFELIIPSYVPSNSEHLICPTPWSMMFGDPVLLGALEESGVSGSLISPELCVKPSRTLMIEAALVALAALPPVVWLFSRRIRPDALPPLLIGSNASLRPSGRD